MIIETRAFARAGLLGNPSDGYYGKTISISVRNFGAQISLYESPELHIEPQEQDKNTYRSIYHMMDSLQLTGYYGGTRLVKAAIKTFAGYTQKQGIKLPGKNFTIRYSSSLPRQVGLAGSSAIITATMRSLMRFYEVDIPKNLLPSLVLSAEVDELGINAGLQDRVIQTYEGCVYMDFQKEYLNKHGYGIYESLNPELLPKLYIAYKTKLSKDSSGKVFNDIKAKFEQGDKKVVETLGQMAQVAEDGKAAILKKDYSKLYKLINKNFDLRCQIMAISDSNMELIQTARNCGASAKFSGSGGAIIGVYEDDDMLNRLLVGMRKIDARVIKPYIQ